MAKLISEEPAPADQIVTVQVPAEPTPHNAQEKNLEEIAEALDLLGDLLMEQSATVEEVAETVEEATEEEEEETTDTTEHEENASALPSAPEIQSDAPPPKNTPPEKPQITGRNGFRRLIFGE